MAGFTAPRSRAACLDNNQAGTSISLAGIVPAPNAGFWFLVRAVNCGGGGTYDSGAASQVAPRDSAIAAGGYGCP